MAPSLPLSLSRLHLSRPEISTAFIANVNNALKVTDRLEKSLLEHSPCVNHLKCHAIHKLPEVNKYLAVACFSSKSKLSKEPMPLVNTELHQTRWKKALECRRPSLSETNPGSFYSLWLNLILLVTIWLLSPQILIENKIHWLKVK